MSRHDWNPQTLRDKLVLLKQERDARQAEKLVQRTLTRQAQNGTIPPPFRDEDFVDEPDVPVKVRVKCQGLPGRICGRMEWSDTMIDVSPIPESVRGDREYLCSGCRETMFRLNLIDRITYLELMGAPTEHVEWYRGKMERDPYMTGRPAGMKGNPKTGIEE